MEAVVEADLDHASPSLGRAGDLFHLGRPEPGGLLDQDVRSGFERHQRERG